MLRVDLGCGASKPDGFVGVDILPGPGVDIVADLNQQFPFPDNSVDEIRAYDAIEHLRDKMLTMNEIWRVCKPGAKVDIFVPSTDGRGAFQDPTHVSFWNINSFFYYCVDFPAYIKLCKKYGFNGSFKVIKLQNEESPNRVIHVRAKLLVVKPRDISESALKQIPLHINSTGIRLEKTLSVYQIAEATPKSSSSKSFPKEVIEAPNFFQEIRELEHYYHCKYQWVNDLHQSILENKNSEPWYNIAELFTQNSNFIPLYFSEFNLKDIYIKRAAILEYILQQNNHEIDFGFKNTLSTRRKTRLGILAAHYQPSAETFAALPVYEYLSREFEVILYSITQTGHPLEQYCQSCANSFKVLPTHLADQVDAIRSDDLDILFIATNVTAVANQVCLLSLHRLARIQVTSGGSVVTTGMRHVDYYISGKLTDYSADSEQHYREKLVRLEGAAHCFSYGPDIEKSTYKADRAKLDIPETSIVFTSGANFFKIIPELIHTWAKIIAAVPNSVLMLFPFGPNWSNTYPKEAFVKYLHTVFLEHEVKSDRLIVLDPQPIPNREDIKQYFKIADVYLDSYPFAGTTSLVEPLQVGLPVIARRGACFRAAMGAALLLDIEIPNLVAHDEESYINLAISLGTNPELRRQKSEQIKQAMKSNPRFLDSRNYSAQIGALFQELFQKYQSDVLDKEFKLRDTNLIIFPDWSQPEEVLLPELQVVLEAVARHPEKGQMTLLIDTSGISAEDADLAISSVAMNLMMESDLDVSEGPEISLVTQLSEVQWQALLPRLQGRVRLEYENQEAIAESGVREVAAIALDSLSS